MTVNWKGVLPAITTPFEADLSVDHVFLAEHARWMVDAGCVGIVPFGSLGEGATLATDEKLAMIRTLVDALGADAPVVPAVSALATADAVAFVRDAEAEGADGFMVLPPYVYSSDDREMRAHFEAALAATTRPCMLYNNPVAYGTDFLPPTIRDLHDAHPHLTAVKESSADLRRLAWLRAELVDRDVTLSMGVDDLALEAFTVGAEGWIAGMVNALPHESVRLFELGRAGDYEAAFDLYRWFLPLLRLDIGTKFVQKIKLAQDRIGRGDERVRPPRLTLEGDERAETLAVVDAAMATRPTL